MYIIKNALRCISRSKGRNILIGIIAVVISISACLGLSIRQASENAKATALQGMNVTATISFDRSGAMSGLGGFPGSGGFDPEDFADLMGSASFADPGGIPLLRQSGKCAGFLLHPHRLL